MADAVVAGDAGQDARNGHGLGETGMATFRLGFHGMGDLNASNAAGGVAVPLTPGSEQGLCIPGTYLSLAATAPGLTPLAVTEDADPASNGSANAAGVRLTEDTSLGPTGAEVVAGHRLLIAAEGPIAAELTFHLISIAGVTAGLVGLDPLQPGVAYRITTVTAPDAAFSLHSLGLADPPMNPKVWDPVFCFTHGTLIDTPDGPRLIEDLSQGDLVTTLGNGSQPLRWIGRRLVTRAEMSAAPDLQPVEFAAGAIGNTRPLAVSPQHRILLNDWRAQVYFGEDQVLIPAKAMINGTTIRQVLPPDGVTYIHLLFDRHEILLSEGALSESFHPGEAGLGALDAAQRREIEVLFPDLDLIRRRAACPIVKLAEARALRLPG